MTENTNPEAVQEQLMAAMSHVDSCIDDLVRIELREKLPALEKAEADAAEALQVAIDNLAPCQEAIAALDEEIKAAEGHIAELSTVSYDSPVEDRVEVRRAFAAWNDELSDLHRRRDIAEQEANPFEQAKHEAQQTLAKAAKDRADLESSLLYPRVGPAQETLAYRAYRAFGGHLVPVLMDGPQNWQYSAGLAWLDAFLDAIGYQEITAERARAAKNYWQRTFNDYQSRVTPATGREVMENTIADLTVSGVNYWAQEHQQGNL